MTSNITLRLEMTPNRKLSHNASRGRTMWSIGKWNKEDREKAYLSVMDQSDKPFWGVPSTDPVRVTVTIYWGKLLGTDGKMRQARRLDWDSATALCKPMLDGALMDTGILADDSQIKAGTVLQEVAADGVGYTVIEIERMTMFEYEFYGDCKRMKGMPTTMPTNSPSEMSNEELLSDLMWPKSRNEWKRQCHAELLRRLNRAEGLEARLIAETDYAIDAWFTSEYGPSDLVRVRSEVSAEVATVIQATFAAVRDEGVRGE